MSGKYANIFDYADFRKYLADYQAAREERDKGFSKSKMCVLLGLPNTRSYLNDVLRGKRVSPEFIERFVKALDLDEEEAEYFRVLVPYNQATEKDKARLFDLLVSLNRTPKKHIDSSAYDYYLEWKHSAVRAVLDLGEFRNAEDIGRRMRPVQSGKSVQESLDLMLEHKLIKKESDGTYRPTDRSITAGKYIQDELVKQHQLAWLNLGKQALLHPPGGPHNTSCLTLTLSREMLTLLEAKLQKFKSEIRSMVHKDPHPATVAYQLNIQLFSFLGDAGE